MASGYNVSSPVAIPSDDIQSSPPPSEISTPSGTPVPPPSISSTPTASDEDLERRLWAAFPGFTMSERMRDTATWSWQFGYDIQRAGKRKWAEARAKATREAPRSPSISDYFGLNTYNPREQALANTLIKNFDKKQFRRLLIDWIVERNHPFTIVEEEKLRVIFEYLNPCASIAAKILDVIDTYGIKEKISYFTLDNAKNNDTAMEVIGGELGFNGAYRRNRCIGHTLNLFAKALLFGHDIEAFEASIYGEEALTIIEHELWRKKGPVGKLYNLVAENQLTDHDWEVLKLTADILKYFEDAVMTFEGDGIRRLRKRGWLRYGPSTMGSDDSVGIEARDALGEYRAWCMDFEPGDREVQDPIAYWIQKSVKYFRLSRMALDFLTIQPMSAECERFFSATGRMVNELRNRLDVMLIEMCQTLRSWHRAGVINNFDVLFTSPDEAREMAKLQAMTDEEIKEWATNWLNAESEDEMLDDEEDSLFVAEEGDVP
ncbi:hypothetical protein DL768_002945 [Monosporascus sp. mg162]|nr:hypothetical protein DL768_002945 [Monosporascus sp. mg162]